MNIKPIETYYNGYRFRSRLEARWAVFFDALGVDYEYEPEGFKLPDGTQYLPDFLIRNVKGRLTGDLFVEVKGLMNNVDLRKIEEFYKLGHSKKIKNVESITPILIVGNIPIGPLAYTNSTSELPEYYYNFYFIDGDYFTAHPGVNINGEFELFGDDYNYLLDMDEHKTKSAYLRARQARFEHGETPKVIESSSSNLDKNILRELGFNFER